MVAAVVLIVIVLLIFDLYQRFYKPGIGTRTWPELAARTGLTHEPSRGPWSNRAPVRVTGNYRGYDLKLDIPKVVHGPVDDGIATYRTRVVLTMNSRVSGSLSLHPRWFFSRGFLRGEGIQIEDEAFNRRFVIKSQPEAFAARVLASADLRRRLLAQKKLREFALSNLGVRLELKGIESDVMALHSLLNLVADIVQTVKRID